MQETQAENQIITTWKLKFPDYSNDLITYDIRKKVLLPRHRIEIIKNILDKLPPMETKIGIHKMASNVFEVVEEMASEYNDAKCVMTFGQIGDYKPFNEGVWVRKSLTRDSLSFISDWGALEFWGFEQPHHKHYTRFFPKAGKNRQFCLPHNYELIM